MGLRAILRMHALTCAALLLLPALASAASAAQQQRDLALRAQPDLQHGESLFKVCVACHASDGGGSRNGDVPTIAGQYRSVLVSQLVNFHYGKRWDVRMEGIAKSHYLSNAQDLADIAAYISTLPRIADPGRGNGERLQHGMKVYQQLCASCHGASGEGDEQQAIPWLAGQHYEYLLREMYYTFDHRRPNLAGHISLLDRFTRPEFEGVADYLSGLAPSVSGQ